MQKHTKILFLILCFYLSIQVTAQTGIGTTTPHASAKLDVSATNKGFLPPRVTLTSNTDVTTIISPAEGLFVYNLGSVGLQAGYYYWNGANWATIATATSAGNGVTASDMVKIYDGVGNAATINSTGATFSVTTSGKYLFDFSTSATCANCNVTLNFQVRDGSNNNAVIASDMQTSYSNNVHAEYNGKVEANLTAGRSYNVLVTASAGNIYNNDYTRVYMKQVSGNLPVTGQSVDYVSVVRTTSQTVNTGDNLIFNTINGGNIPYNSSTGSFSLSAGKTYRLTGSVSMDGSTAINSAMDIAWKTAAGDILGNRGLTISTNYNSTAVGNGLTDIVYTPTINTTVSLNVISSSANAKTVANYTFANIEQIGSSAIVNPWVLSGTDVYNTTGEVGIGTATPAASALLDLTSTSKGMLIPRMTASQKNAISSPTTGLLIFQTDAPSDFYHYNGSSWISLTEPNWTSAGTIQSVGWSATTTAPTIGTTTVNDYSYKQIGSKTWRCQLTFSAGSNSIGANSGSGDYLFTLPNGLQFNTSIAGQAAYSADVGRSIWDWPGLWLSSSSGSITNLSQGGLLYVVPYSSTQYRLIHVGIATIGAVIPYASGYYGVGSNISWRVTFTFQSL